MNKTGVMYVGSYELRLYIHKGPVVNISGYACALIYKSFKVIKHKGYIGKVRA